MDCLSLKPGDICPDCQRDGFEKRLKNFLINLENETLLKCESDTCMYPYNDEFTSSEDESLPNDESELETNLDIFIENSIQKNFGNHSSLEELNSNKIGTEKVTQEFCFPFTYDKNESNKSMSVKRKVTTPNNNLNSEHMVEFKNEPLCQYKPTANVPIAKKTKVEIQSVTTIQPDPRVTILPTIPASTSSYQNEKPSPPSNAGGSVPKASLIIGRQFLQHMEAMDKNKTFANPKVKATKSQNKIIKESKTNNKTKTSNSINFNEVSKFLLNNINNAKTSK